MMRLPPFTYLAPRTLHAAATALAEHGADAMLVAGGTDLYPNMKRRQFEPKVLVGIGGVAELRGVRGTARDGFTVVTAAPQHGHHRWQSLRGHALQLLQPELRVAEGDRLLHEERRRDLPRRAG